MAIGAATVWRVRISGNNANGGGYDATISGAGTDYTQQDSPQLSLTDIACSATTTVTSATGGFTSAMIGNAIRITGGGATSGWYFITARTDTNTITVDRTPGTVTAGTGKVGGGLATYQSVWDSANATGNKCVAGNTIYLQGSGSSAPTSDDYTFTSYIIPVPGDTTNGLVRMIGENGMPRIRGNGLVTYQASRIWLENIYITTNSNSNGTLGMICADPSGSGVFIVDCVLNTAGQSSIVGTVLSQGSGIYNTEVIGVAAGSPTSSSGCYGISINGYAVEILGCRIRHCRDHGVYINGSSYPANAQFNLIYGNVGDGIYCNNGATVGGLVANNTIDGNGGHGINIITTAATQWNSFYNNIISNHAGSGKKGINVAAGTTAVNDRVKRLIDYNVLYNNTANYGSVSAGANDSTANPTYANSGSGDFTPTNTALKGLAYPSAIGSTTVYRYPGAIQPDAAGGAAGMLYIGGMSGGFE